MRIVFVLAAGLLLTGCDGILPWGSTAPDSTAVADSVPGEQDGSVSDTVRTDSSAVPAEVAEPGTQEGDSARQADTVPDSVAAAATDTTLAARLERLESENDSLRAALTGLATAVGLQAQDEAPAFEPRQLWAWIVRGLFALGFLILVAALIRTVIWALERLAETNAKRRLFFKRLVPITRILIWVAALPFTAMVILGIDARGILAAGAAIGVAVGFAAQDILKNIFGGIIVLFDQPFQVGDKVSIHGTYGEVVSIGLRSTRLVTSDDNLVSVPNAQVVGDQVANANAGELNCQVVTDLYLPGWVDEAKAKRIAFEAATSSKYVYLNKPVVVLVKDEFKETFLTHLKVKAYVLDPRHEFLFMSDVTERARAEFRRAGLLSPMHGVRAYVDLDRWPPEHGGGPGAGDSAAPEPAPGGEPAAATAEAREVDV